LKRVFGAIAGALTMAALAAAGDAQIPKLPPPPPGPQIGQMAPAFALAGLHGGRITLAQFRGRVVFLDFWATWCEPCRQEVPKLAALQTQFGGHGFTVLGVALDDGGAAVVKPAARELGINYPVALGTIPVAAAYGGMEGLPTAFLVGRDGKVVQIYYGVQPQAALRRAIREALAR
jgi:thiol-disulfide isomerase/thioredoxin